MPYVNYTAIFGSQSDHVPDILGVASGGSAAFHDMKKGICNGICIAFLNHIFIRTPLSYDYILSLWTNDNYSHI